MKFNATIQRQLRDDLKRRRHRITDIREYVLCYDELVPRSMSYDLRKELLLDWDREIEKETEQCQKLENLIRRGFNT